MVKNRLATAVASLTGIFYLVSAPWSVSTPALGPNPENPLVKLPKPYEIIVSPQDNPVPENINFAVSKVSGSKKTLFSKDHVPYILSSGVLQNEPIIKNYHSIEELLELDSAKYNYKGLDKKIAEDVKIFNEAPTEQQERLNSNPLYWEVVQIYNGMKGVGFKFPPYITPELIWAEIAAESTGFVGAVSKEGAVGLMQELYASYESTNPGESRANFNATVSKPSGAIYSGLKFILNKVHPQLKERYIGWKDLKGFEKAIEFLTAYDEGYNRTIARRAEEVAHPNNEFFKSNEATLYPWRVFGAFAREFPYGFKKFVIEFSSSSNDPRSWNPEAWRKYAPDPKIKSVKDFFSLYEFETTFVNYMNYLKSLKL